MSKEASRGKLARRVNWLVNVALALAGVALVVVLARSFLGEKATGGAEPIEIGARLNLKDVAWNVNGQESRSSRRLFITTMLEEA